LLTTTSYNHFAPP